MVRKFINAPAITLQQAQEILRKLSREEGGEIIPFDFTSHSTDKTKAERTIVTPMLYIRGDGDELKDVADVMLRAGFKLNPIYPTYIRPLIHARFGKELGEQKIAELDIPRPGCSRPKMGQIAQELGLFGDGESSTNSRGRIIPQKDMQEFMALERLPEMSKRHQKKSIAPDGDHIQDKSGYTRDDL